MKKTIAYSSLLLASCAIGTSLSSPPDTRQHPPKLDALTSMRFFAAAMIVLQHADLHFWNLRSLYWMNLKQGVTFFFVLSGFILFYNYPKLETGKAVAKFLVARFARVWPAAALAASIALASMTANLNFPANGSHLFWMAFCEFTLIKSWIPRFKYYMGVNPPAWSISVELFFYLLFPLLVLNFRKTWLKKLLLCATVTGATIASAYFIFPAQPQPSDRHFEHWLLYFNPSIRLLEFALGMSAALLFLRLRQLPNLSKELITCFQIIGFASVCLALPATLMPWAELIKTIPAPLQFWFDGSGACFAFAFFIVTMAFSEGFLSRGLAHPFLVFLGEASYSLYLLHWTCERWLAVQIETGKIPVPNAIAGWEVGAAFSLALISASAFVYLFVENPSRRFITAAFSAWMDRRENRRLLERAGDFAAKTEEGAVSNASSAR